MVKLIVHRIISAIALMAGLLTVMFAIIHLAPGDPVQSMIAPTIPARVAVELRHQFGLDQTLPAQYGHWLWNAVKGNLGVSFSHQRPVSDVLLQFFSNTAILALAAILLEVALGLSIGLAAVRFHGSLIEKAVMNASLIVCTLPTFWIGLVLLAAFSYSLGLFPSSQMHSVDAEHLSTFESVGDLLLHLVLPALTIAIPGAATIARFVHPNLLKVRREEYVTFAWSLGLSRRRIFFRYELPNAISPVITLLGLEIGTLLSGALVTETIFAWPGMGRLAVQAISARDYPLVMGCALFSGILVITGNLIADILYNVADPRMRAAS
ncbi:MAG TPA: ABC transporter permease [Bacteroidota bacterium]|nr:ABC transporter permease [Bacteroidota bacterium]